MSTEDPRRLVRAAAADQMALFTRDQATEVGLTRDLLRGERDRGLLETPFPDVFALAGVPWTQARQHLAAVLAGGDRARATHRAGAWAWELTSFNQKPEISIPLERYARLKDVRIHRASDLPELVVVRRGVPTTGVNRVLIDLGAVKPRSVRDALDRAVAKKHTTPMQVLAELNELAKRGRRGVGVMRAVLDDAGITGSHPPSVLEAKTRRLIRDAGLPQPECEFAARANGEYRLDFCWPELMLVVEVSGWQYHSSFDAFHKDMTRQNSLTIEGYGLLEYSWLHITREAKRVTAEIRVAHRARTALFA